MCELNILLDVFWIGNHLFEKNLSAIFSDIVGTGSELIEIDGRWRAIRDVFEKILKFFSE